MGSVLPMAGPLSVGFLFAGLWPVCVGLVGLSFHLDMPAPSSRRYQPTGQFRAFRRFLLLSTPSLPPGLSLFFPFEGRGSMVYAFFSFCS